MSHRNARLAPAGRMILIQRVTSGRPVAHVAKEMGISRPTAYRWVNRYRDEGLPGLEDRSSKPKSCPHATSPAKTAEVLASRTEHRTGPADIAARTGVGVRTVSRILTRAGMPKLWDLDPLTGTRIRAGRATERRYERDAPGDMVHIDVKKLGRIPDGGGWRADPKQSARNHNTGHTRVGFDYVHVAVDDHSRLAFVEVHPDEKGFTCAGFLERAAAFMAAHGAPVQRVMTDNAFAYRLSNDFQSVLTALDAKHILIKPRHPWQNGKAERFNRTLQEGWAYRQVFDSNQARTDALGPWLDFYNHQRPHTSLGGKAPITRCNQRPV
ncbi:IS481 family transposase [Arthrobacter jiangjiafuii]|uniref:IS481 family transposase n=1 Tax=Arthrobacter jiangjiafuii TaxID=2817475 RepID=A0A975M3S0_9MICC|nr:IS481 family transposase [Arthrobacter jiangjiafuii]MBP3045211.1 IS481 family transposase [Arthrobacter jiangjiafuii]QWC09415.1 IS481 family transposase [Arthrobacter jiangjiafuii]QWC10602.1 IS481 family transposase [Arthrobacter jiangjiafuii]